MNKGKEVKILHQEIKRIYNQLDKDWLISHTGVAVMLDSSVLFVVIVLMVQGYSLTWIMQRAFVWSASGVIGFMEVNVIVSLTTIVAILEELFYPERQYARFICLGLKYIVLSSIDEYKNRIISRTKKIAKNMKKKEEKISNTRRFKVYDIE